MNISVSRAQGRVPVTVFKLDGQLDGQTYQDLVNKAKELYAAGGRDFLLDMSDLTYISSAGLVAMHTIALLLRGRAVSDPEDSWASIRAAEKTAEGETQEHIKLLNPRDEVKSVLDMVGFGNVFEVFTNPDEAVKSF